MTSFMMSSQDELQLKIRRRRTAKISSQLLSDLDFLGALMFLKIEPGLVAEFRVDRREDGN